MGSLQDALLKSGLAKERPQGASKPAGSSSPKRNPGRRPDGSGKGRRPPSARAGNVGQLDAAQNARKTPHGQRTKSDLERAWQARRRAEAAEKERIKQARVADQEARRKRNLVLDGIIEGHVLNDEAGELPRYFEHLGRIRRVLCTEEQRRRINAGELGIVNLRGRYLIVEREVLERYRALAPDLVPDLSGKEPETEVDGDWPPVPDDITW